MKFFSLNKREICDLELLINQGFYPLKGFLSKNDYASVLENMRLENGILWPIPLCLSIDEAQKKEFEKEEKIILKDRTGINIAYLYIKEIYQYNLEYECEKVFGSFDLNHPYQKIMKENFSQGRIYYVGGEVRKIRDIDHYDFLEIRKNPTELKNFFKEKKIKKIVAFQTRNPTHKSHFHLTLNALEEAGADSHLLLHPVVGVTQDRDIEYHLRVICYKKLIKHYKKDRVTLSLLPLSMRMAGPKEAVWHAIIRKNYGATHFIVGRDHAGPSYRKSNGDNFYGNYEAQDLLKKYADEIGIKIINSKTISYVKELDKYLPASKITNGLTAINISGTEQRELLNQGKDFPEWYSFPEIIDELQKSIRPKIDRGFCVYLVGIPASGKSTLANFLITRLKENITNRKITLLDGDVIRKNLSKGLGFSVKDRKANIERIGFVANEIVKHGGISIVANIAPFSSSRLKNKLLIEGNNGEYIEVYVKTKLSICIKRDPKGLYKKAQQGIIKNLTGYNDTFEEPKNPDLTLNGENENIGEELDKIIAIIKERGLM